eukprot:3513338-Amphidinium_carterae.2
MTIGKLESHALLAAAYSQEFALLLCDFANAFGAISRQWILHCMRRSGMCGGLLRLFLTYCDPARSFLAGSRPVTF